MSGIESRLISLVINRLGQQDTILCYKVLRLASECLRLAGKAKPVSPLAFQTDKTPDSPFPSESGFPFTEESRHSPKISELDNCIKL